MLRLDQPIRTRRLVLRTFSLGDVDDVWDYQRRPEVARFLRWEARTRPQTHASVEQMIGECALVAAGDCLTRAVALPDGGPVVGQVELVWLSPQDGQGEVGFIFHPAYGGRGLATEAATAMLRIGFEDLGLHRIIGRCAAQNAASARLLQRLGMRREAHFVGNARFKGGWREELVFALLEDEWRARIDGH